jgi:phosphoribosylformylglycinamidine synthase
VKSAHDCSEGGLAVALAESCLSNPVKQLGATIDFGDTGLRGDQLLFNESQGRIVISVPGTNVGAVLMLLELRGIPARKIGTVGGDLLKISVQGEVLAWPLPELHAAWYDAIARAMSA